MIAPYPLKFFPIPKVRIWGGHKLKKCFGYTGIEPVGEYWVLSSHPNGISIVANGALKGSTLKEVTSLYPEYYLGKSPQDRFPIMIKFLDICQDLSVQVHPNDDYAQKHEGDFGKTESWYILDTKKDGSIIYGHHFKNKEDFHKAVQENKVKEYLNYVSIQPGQSILVPSRTLHALRADTTLIEIQQTSDVTYRVYDWDRVDSEGKSRPLHVEKASDVLRYKDNLDTINFYNKDVIYKSSTVQHYHIAHCPYFSIEELCIIRGDYCISNNEGEALEILIIAKGSGLIQYGKKKYPLHIRQGDAILVPKYEELHRIGTESELTLLRTTYP